MLKATFVSDVTMSHIIKDRSHPQYGKYRSCFSLSGTAEEIAEYKKLNPRAIVNDQFGLLKFTYSGNRTNHNLVRNVGKTGQIGWFAEESAQAIEDAIAIQQAKEFGAKVQINGRWFDFSETKSAKVEQAEPVSLEVEADSAK